MATGADHGMCVPSHWVGEHQCGGPCRPVVGPHWAQVLHRVCRPALMCARFAPIRTRALARAPGDPGITALVRRSGNSSWAPRALLSGVVFQKARRHLGVAEHSCRRRGYSFVRHAERTSTTALTGSRTMQSMRVSKRGFAARRPVGTAMMSTAGFGGSATEWPSSAPFELIASRVAIGTYGMLPSCARIDALESCARMGRPSRVGGYRDSHIPQIVDTVPQDARQCALWGCDAVDALDHQVGCFPLRRLVGIIDSDATQRDSASAFCGVGSAAECVATSKHSRTPGPGLAGRLWSSNTTCVKQKQNPRFDGTTHVQFPETRQAHSANCSLRGSISRHLPLLFRL